METAILIISKIIKQMLVILKILQTTIMILA